MKALFFSMALAAGLVLWGSEPQAGVDNLISAILQHGPGGGTGPVGFGTPGRCR
jgi:hypothetical protein